jgi:hypothetical protein
MISLLAKLLQPALPGYLVPELILKDESHKAFLVI